MRIVVIGMGYWGRIHIDKLIHLDAFGGACDIESDYRTIIKNKKPDGVVIATNSINHFPIAKYCINRDISVYVEKPIATEIDQIKQYDRMLKRHDVRFQAGFQMLYDPIIQAHAKNETKFRKLVPVIKDVRSLIKKYDEVTEKESAQGVKITESEWKSLAQEALNLVKDIVGWWSWRMQR